MTAAGDKGAAGGRGGGIRETVRPWERETARGWKTCTVTNSTLRYMGRTVEVCKMVREGQLVVLGIPWVDR